MDGGREAGKELELEQSTSIWCANFLAQEEFMWPKTLPRALVAAQITDQDLPLLSGVQLCVTNLTLLRLLLSCIEALETYPLWHLV